MNFRWFLSAILSFAAMECSVTMAQSSKGEDLAAIDFTRDIRPLLSDRCFLCHGPDAGTREAELRLDLEEGALSVIPPGKPHNSELVERIFSEEKDVLMPPPESKLSLTTSERNLLARWIQEGAQWEKHWAFVPRKTIQPPEVESEDLVEGPIDRFLLSRLEREKLSYSSFAAKETLIRRLSFDLTGLPPSLDDIDAFLDDTSSDAYEKIVDRLLDSPHYGQRMASDWLDIARYSDTYGYQVDRDRYVWPWRDWVIRSFNSNMRYDQFITEQIAGDLLPQATDDQILATTFNRLHPQKVEGGSTEEEFRVEYVADRTQTFATAFLGLTMECARCHDHKYDPISQQEYYQLFSFFNNIDESGLYSFFTNSVPTPTLSLTSDEQKQTLETLKQKVEEIKGRQPALDQESFDQPFIERVLALKGTPPVEVVDFTTASGGNRSTVDARGNPAVLLTGDDAVPLKSGNFTRYQPFSISLSLLVPDFMDRAVVFHRSRAWTDAGSRGYQVLIEEGRLSASLIHFWPGNALSVSTVDKIPVNEWFDLAVVYDGSIDASGLAIFINGERVELEVVKNHLTKNITGGGGNHIAIGERFRDRGFKGGQVSEFRVFDRQLSELETRMSHDPKAIAERLRKALGKGGLADSQKRLLVEHVLLNESDSARKHRQELKDAREQLSRFLDGLTEIMVMREMAEPKPAFILNRGLYSDRLKEVFADFPSAIPVSGESFSNDRLGLARWLTNPSHPLTARVAVNHFWQLVFGQGLVTTPEDFGLQGAPPTHPDLLDWLANDFVSSGWDIRRLLKQMVMSRAYRQSSFASKELVVLDPANALLARAPSYRLSAEMLRDNVLHASGLLVDEIGGPPVRPYELAASFKASNPSQGKGLYRRSLYTYWKRTGPAPVMLVLDAAKRDVCRVKRERTSSPLQALAMLNGPQFVEASRAMSQRLLDRYGPKPVDRIAQDMFRTLTSRAASPNEMRIIKRLYTEQYQHFLGDTASALSYLSLGEFGSYQKMADKMNRAVMNWPLNNHDLRLGASPANTEEFTGSFGRASLFTDELRPEQIARLVSAGHEGDLPDGLVAKIGNRMSDQEMQAINAGSQGHVVFTGTSGLIVKDAFSLEAWVRPSGARRGRIWDKITPGQADGLLLDLVGGIRLICGDTVVTVDRQLPDNQWSHIACSVNLANGEVKIYHNGEQVYGNEMNDPPVSAEDLAVLAAWSAVANTLINHDECVTKR